MKKHSSLIVCLVTLVTTLACVAGAAQPTVTLIPSPPPLTTASINPPPAATEVAQPPVAQPTQAQPAATSAPSFPTPTRIAPQGGPTSVGVTRVKIYLVAIGDGGKSGPQIGCGDSAVAVDRDVAPTQAPLQTALSELFSIHDQFYGQSGLYNALYSSNLSVVKLNIDDNGLATINLSGTLSLAGECDDPRVQAQIEYTARQFPTVKDVSVFLNGQPLKDLLGGKGAPSATP